jgi:hypothetical protein
VASEASKLDLDMVEKELGATNSFVKMAQEIEIMTRLGEEKPVNHWRNTTKIQ